MELVRKRGAWGVLELWPPWGGRVIGGEVKKGLIFLYKALGRHSRFQTGERDKCVLWN